MGKNWRGFWLLTEMKWKKTWSFKLNLAAQAVAMILNNLGFLAAWGLLLARFGNINGYTIWEIVLIQGFVAVWFALFFWLIGGVARSLADYIEQDRILDLQLYPIDVLVNLATKSGEATQFGDLVEGVILLGIYCFMHPGALVWVVVGLGVSLAGMWGIALFFNSLLFFWPRMRDFFQNLVIDLYVGGGMYPSDNFKGMLRYLFFAILIVPIIFYPIEAIRGVLGWQSILVSVMCVAGINILGLWVWNAGLRRLESGSGGGIVE